jgi:hypothetical protein
VVGNKGVAGFDKTAVADLKPSLVVDDVASS